MAYRSFHSFDIDFPVECDDEYWDHPDPKLRFKQPPNKPSSATAFILYIKVLKILGSSLRTIVCQSIPFYELTILKTK